MNKYSSLEGPLASNKENGSFLIRSLCFVDFTVFNKNQKIIIFVAFKRAICGILEIYSCISIGNDI